MKIRLQKSKQKKAGMATIVVIGLLSVILVFVAGNLRTLYLLRNDLRFIEQQQTNRLAKLGPLTNSAPLIDTAPKPGDGHPSPAKDSR
jgi:hypothetical protein